jgi:hypothetical protein
VFGNSFGTVIRFIWYGDSKVGLYVLVISWYGDSNV